MHTVVVTGVLILALANVGSLLDSENYKQQSYQEQLQEYYQNQRLYEQQKQHQLHQMQLARHKLHLQQNILPRDPAYSRPSSPQSVHTITHTAELQNILPRDPAYSPQSSPQSVHTITHTGELQRALHRRETWLVLIYAPWCGHSRKAIKEWHNVAAESRRIRSRNITIAAFDVKAFSLNPVPNTLYSRYIPTVRLFSPEVPNGIEYDGRVTTENVIRWTYHELHKINTLRNRHENE